MKKFIAYFAGLVAASALFISSCLLSNPQPTLGQNANGDSYSWSGGSIFNTVVTASAVTSATIITKTPMKIWTASATAVTNVSAVTFILDVSIDNFSTSTPAVTVTKGTVATTGSTYLPAQYYRVRCTGYTGAAGPVTNATCYVLGMQ